MRAGVCGPSVCEGTDGFRPPRLGWPHVPAELGAAHGARRWHAIGRGQWGEATKRIAALSEVDTHQFGIAILTRDGDLVCGGDVDTPFSIQSISKVFSLELALEGHGSEMWDRVGRDPSGDPYNSIIDLERHCGIPRNPFINAGALVVIDMLLDRYSADEEVGAVINFVTGLLDGDDARLCTPVRH